MTSLVRQKANRGRLLARIAGPWSHQIPKAGESNLDIEADLAKIKDEARAESAAIMKKGRRARAQRRVDLYTPPCVGIPGVLLPCSDWFRFLGLSVGNSGICAQGLQIIEHYRRLTWVNG